MADGFTGEGYWKENRLKMQNLRRVKMREFDATFKLVCELIEFLLINAPMLEEMVVGSPGGTVLEVTKL